MNAGRLVLEDGTEFIGNLLNNHSNIGEVVFNTSNSGYEEMATDPSYHNQILVTTTPMQGNYGVDSSRWESEKLHITGMVCLEMQNSTRDSSWLKTLSENNVSVIDDINTRELTLHLRERGSLWGGVFSLETSKEDCIAAIATKKNSLIEKDWTEDVSTKEIKVFYQDNKVEEHVGVLDFGCKKNILRSLEQRFSKVTLFPSNTTAQVLLEHSLDGLLLSNGPGDPANVKQPVETIKTLIGKIPMMGICMGHQLLGQALGSTTYKLKFGHRGANHPIKDSEFQNFVFMSSQNHGYALKNEFEDKEVKVSHVNLNDQSVAGLIFKKSFCFSVQFHPENCPGPEEGVYLFDEFKKLISEFKKINSKTTEAQNVL